MPRMPGIPRMLDDDAIARYARQIVVPGIGAAGQERLLATTMLVLGHPRGVAQASLYLEAAGVRVLRAGGDAAGSSVPASGEAVPPGDAPPTSGDVLDAGGVLEGQFAIDVVIVAGTGDLPAPLLSSIAGSGLPACWYTVDADGFTSGVHPDSPLPCFPAPADRQAEALHDAAACDAASLACAIAIGLPHRRGAFRFDL